MKTGLIYKLTSKTSKKSYIGKSMEYRFEYRMLCHSTDFSDTHLGRAKEIVSFLKIENYIELKNIIDNKIEVNGYLVVESVETIESN